MTEYEVQIEGETFSVEVGDVSGPSVHVVVNGVPKTVQIADATPPPKAPEPKAVRAPASAAPKPSPEPVSRPTPAPVSPAEGTDQVVAPMPGKILSITVAVGDAVSEGDILCTLEAMKMEMPISASGSGTVQVVHVQVGDTVAYDAPLVTIG